MKNFLLGLLDLIYKKKCYFCKSSKENSLMCSKCYDSLNFNNNEPLRDFNNSKIYCAGIYEKNIQKMIRGIKYHKQRELAYFQAKFMTEYFNTLELTQDFTVVPVPLFKNRQKQRGYNHMELIGKEFCRQTNLSMNVDLIKRIKETKPQYKLKKHERMENLKNAFEVKPNTLNINCNILLIDDIYTTGSTFESMITELHKNGFYNITCFATVTAR